MNRVGNYIEILDDRTDNFDEEYSNIYKCQFNSTGQKAISDHTEIIYSIKQNTSPRISRLYEPNDLRKDPKWLHLSNLFLFPSTQAEQVNETTIVDIIRLRSDIDKIFTRRATAPRHHVDSDDDTDLHMHDNTSEGSSSQDESDVCFEEIHSSQHPPLPDVVITNMLTSDTSNHIIPNHTNLKSINKQHPFIATNDNLRMHKIRCPNQWQLLSSSKSSDLQGTIVAVNDIYVKNIDKVILKRLLMNIKSRPIKYCIQQSMPLLLPTHIQSTNNDVDSDHYMNNNQKVSSNVSDAPCLDHKNDNPLHPPSSLSLPSNMNTTSTITSAPHMEVEYTDIRIMNSSPNSHQESTNATMNVQVNDGLSIIDFTDNTSDVTSAPINPIISNINTTINTVTTTPLSVNIDDMDTNTQSQSSQKLPYTQPSSSSSSSSPLRPYDAVVSEDNINTITIDKEILLDQILSYDDYLELYNHRHCQYIRKKVELTLKAFYSYNWIDLYETKGSLPQTTIISLYHYIESEMNKLKVCESCLHTYNKLNTCKQTVTSSSSSSSLSPSSPTKSPSSSASSPVKMSSNMTSTSPLNDINVKAIEKDIPSPTINTTAIANGTTTTTTTTTTTGTHDSDTTINTSNIRLDTLKCTSSNIPVHITPYSQDILLSLVYIRLKQHIERFIFLQLQPSYMNPIISHIIIKQQQQQDSTFSPINSPSSSPRNTVMSLSSPNIHVHDSAVCDRYSQSSITEKIQTISRRNSRRKSHSLHTSETHIDTDIDIDISIPIYTDIQDCMQQLSIYCNNMEIKSKSTINYKIASLQYLSLSQLGLSSKYDPPNSLMQKYNTCTNSHNTSSSSNSRSGGPMLRSNSSSSTSNSSSTGNSGGQEMAYEWKLAILLLSETLSQDTPVKMIQSLISFYHYLVNLVRAYIYYDNTPYIAQATDISISSSTITSNTMHNHISGNNHNNSANKSQNSLTCTPDRVGKLGSRDQNNHHHTNSKWTSRQQFDTYCTVCNDIHSIQSTHIPLYQRHILSSSNRLNTITTTTRGENKEGIINKSALPESVIVYGDIAHLNAYRFQEGRNCISDHQNTCNIDSYDNIDDDSISNSTVVYRHITPSSLGSYTTNITSSHDSHQPLNVNITKYRDSYTSLINSYDKYDLPVVRINDIHVNTSDLPVTDQVKYILYDIVEIVEKNITCTMTNIPISCQDLGANEKPVNPTAYSVPPLADDIWLNTMKTPTYMPPPPPLPLFSPSAQPPPPLPAFSPPPLFSTVSNDNPNNVLPLPPPLPCFSPPVSRSTPYDTLTHSQNNPLDMSISDLHNINVSPDYAPPVVPLLSTLQESQPLTESDTLHFLVEPSTLQNHEDGNTIHKPSSDTELNELICDRSCKDAHIISSPSIPPISSSKSSSCLSLYTQEISSDDLLPALIWVVIQLNFPYIDQLLYICQEFHTPDLLCGEASFCLLQLSSAVEFCRTCHASWLDIDLYTDYYMKQRFLWTQKLLYDCQCGHIDNVLEALLNHNADVNGYNIDQSESILSICIKYNRQEIFDEIMKPSYHINVNQYICPYYGDIRHISPLLLAVKYKRLRMIIELLRKGANRYLYDSNGDTPLYVSTMIKNVPMMRLLAVDPAVCQHHFMTLIQSRDKQAITSLMLQGISINILYYSHQDGYWITPLIACIKSLDETILCILLSTVISLHLPFSPSAVLCSEQNKQVSPEDEGCTPLITCTKLFIQEYNKYNIHAMKSLLIMMIMLLRAEIFSSYEFLSARKAHWNQAFLILSQFKQDELQMDISRLTTMDSSDTSQSNVRVNDSNIASLINEILLTEDTSANMFTLSTIHDNRDFYFLLGYHLLLYRQYDPPLPIVTYAQSNDIYGVWSALVMCDDSINELDTTTQSYTALMMAVYHQNYVMIELLLHNKVLSNIGNFSMSTYFGVTPSMYSSPIRSSMMYDRVSADTDVHVLEYEETLEDIFPVFEFPEIRNIDVSIVNKYGQTALHYAVLRNNVDIICRLLSYGIDRNICDNKKRTAIDLYKARYPHMIDVINILYYDPSVYPMYLLAESNDWDGIKSLLYQGHTINMIPDIIAMTATSNSPRHLKKSDSIRGDDMSQTAGITVMSTPVMVPLSKTSSFMFSSSRNLSNTPSHTDMNILNKGNHIGPQPPLITVVIYQHYELLEQLLQLKYIHMIDIDIMNMMGRTALMYATYNYDEKSVLLLLKYGADRYMKDTNGDTAESLLLKILPPNILTLASNTSTSTMTPPISSKYLRDTSTSTITTTTNPTQQMKEIYYIIKSDPSLLRIHDVIYYGDYETMIALLKQGVSPNLPLYDSYKSYPTSPVQSLLQSPSAQDVRRSLRLSRDRSQSPRTPVSSSSGSDLKSLNNSNNNSNNNSIGGVILESPVNTPVSLPTNSNSNSNSNSKEMTYINGITPLMVACIKGMKSSPNHMKIIHKLLELSEVITHIDMIDDERGWSALFHASNMNQDDTVLLLLQLGANRYLKDKYDMIAYDYALGKGYKNVIALLEADPQIVSIHDECSAGHIDIVDALLKQGCNINYMDNRECYLNQTPLMVACSCCHYPVVKLLLSYRDPITNRILCDINARDVQGRTALMLSAGMGALDLTELLLIHGANKELTDYHNMTASQYAKLHGTSTYLSFLAQKLFR